MSGLSLEDEIRSLKQKEENLLEKYWNRTFGKGVLTGVLIMSLLFSGFLYWDSVDHRVEVPVTVVTCDDCSYDRFESATDRMFRVSYEEVEYSSEEGQELIDEHSLSYVPSFIFGEEVEKAENFTAIKPSIYESGDYYVLRTEGPEVAQRLSDGKQLE